MNEQSKQLARAIKKFAEQEMVSAENQEVIMYALHVALDEMPDMARGEERFQLFNNEE